MHIDEISSTIKRLKAKSLRTKSKAILLFPRSYWVCGHVIHNGDAAAAWALLSFAHHLVASGGVCTTLFSYVHNTFFVCAQRLEHDAFLPLWLVRFVLPPALSGSTLAPTSSQGRYSPLPSSWRAATACAPAFHRHFIYAKRTEAPSVSAPMHILQLWVWERFPELRPAMAMASILDYADDGDVPRASRWHDAHWALDPRFFHAVFMTPKEF